MAVSAVFVMDTSMEEKFLHDMIHPWFLLFTSVRNKGEKYYLQLGESPAAKRVN